MGTRLPVHSTSWAYAVRRQGRLNPYASSLRYRVGKRAFDLVFAGLGLVLLAPVLVLCIALVGLASGRPIFFVQRRRGERGRAFVIFKLRTMVNKPPPLSFPCIRPQITAVGRVLRALSLDELPQLVNVLSGAMSFVGPRPHPVGEDEYYGAVIDSYWQRYAAKPGLTGLAQINGLRGPTTIASMTDRVEYDLRYLKQQSAWLDLQIVLLTPLAILRDCVKQVLRRR